MGTLGPSLGGGEGWSEKRVGGRKRGSGASQRKGAEPGGRGSEQVLRLGNSPSRGVSELSLGQARSPREPGQWGLHLPAWCCLLLSAVPPPCEGLQARGDLQPTPKDRSLALFWDQPPCPGG